MAPPALVSKEVPDIEVSVYKCYVNENLTTNNHYEIYLCCADYFTTNVREIIWVVHFSCVLNFVAFDL